jgi:hypothetical protein
MAPIRIAASRDGGTRPIVNAGTIDSERQHVEQAIPDASKSRDVSRNAGSIRSQNPFGASQSWIKASNPAAPFLMRCSSLVKSSLRTFPMMMKSNAASLSSSFSGP